MAQSQRPILHPTLQSSHPIHILSHSRSLFQFQGESESFARSFIDKYSPRVSVSGCDEEGRVEGSAITLVIRSARHFAPDGYNAFIPSLRSDQGERDYILPSCLKSRRPLPLSVAADQILNVTYSATEMLHGVSHPRINVIINVMRLLGPKCAFQAIPCLLWVSHSFHSTLRYILYRCFRVVCTATQVEYSFPS